MFPDQVQVERKSDFYMAQICIRTRCKSSSTSLKSHSSSIRAVTRRQHKLVCAVVLLKSSFRIAGTRIRPHHPPEWKLCVEVAVPVSIDPLTIIQQLFMVLGDVNLILVHQATTYLFPTFTHC